MLPTESIASGNWVIKVCFHLAEPGGSRHQVQVCRHPQSFKLIHRSRIPEKHKWASTKKQFWSWILNMMWKSGLKLLSTTPKLRKVSSAQHALNDFLAGKDCYEQSQNLFKWQEHSKRHKVDAVDARWQAKTVVIFLCSATIPWRRVKLFERQDSAVKEESAEKVESFHRRGWTPSDWRSPYKRWLTKRQETSCHTTENTSHHNSHSVTLSWGHLPSGSSPYWRCRPLSRSVDSGRKTASV